MDLKKILGEAYKDGMTFEEIEEALRKIELPEDKSAEIERLKAAISKSNSEAADYKRKLREKLSDDEKKAQEEKEKRDELEEKYNKLLHETAAAKHKAKLLALGYEEALAEDTAAALVAGETEKLFVNQLKHQQNLEKKIKAEALKQTPPPVGGTGDNAMTLEKLKEMSLEQRYEFSIKNPEEYKALYAGGNE